MFPVLFVNKIDEEIPLETFLSSREFDPSLKQLEKALLNCCPGCTCEDNCMDSSKCECQKTTVNIAKGFRPELTDSSLMRYNNRKLTLPLRTGLFECNKNCKCQWNICPNRVVQLPFSYQVPVTVRRTPIHWELCATSDIPAGTFIFNYLGVVHASDTMLQEDMRPPNCLRLDLAYKFAKNISSSQEKIKECFESEEVSQFMLNENNMFYIRGGLKGNVGQFMSYSPQPNMRKEYVFVDTHDFRFPWLSFFANRDIEADEPLTYDFK